EPAACVARLRRPQAVGEDGSAASASGGVLKSYVGASAMRVRRPQPRMRLPPYRAQARSPLLYATSQLWQSFPDRRARVSGWLMVAIPQRGSWHSRRPRALPTATTARSEERRVGTGGRDGRGRWEPE